MQIFKFYMKKFLKLEPTFYRAYEMNLLHSLAVISSPNERKMPDALSPSQIHIKFGDGGA